MTNNIQQIRLTVTRPLWSAGQSSPVGAVLLVDPLEAHVLLGSGRVQLVDPRDLAAVQAAAWAHTKKVCPPAAMDARRIWATR